MTLRRTALCAVLVAVGAAACKGRQREAPAGSPSGAPSSPPPVGNPVVVELDLTRGAPEIVPSSLLGPARQRTHTDLIRAIRAIGEGEGDKGVFVRLGTSRVPFSRAEEIGRLLGAVRKNGRPVVCHADDYNNGNLLLAALACDKLWISAAGSVDSVGIAAQLLFANKLLKKLQIDADFVQIGKYKGAEEPFTRDEPSPEARETLERTLAGLRTAWLAGISGGRGKDLSGLVEDGPFAATEAKEKGLVDEIGYADDARDAAKKLVGVEHSMVRFGAGEAPPGVPRGIVEILRAVSGAGRGGTPRVAVLRAVGAISMAPTGVFGQTDGITERETSRALARLTKDPSVKAVVLRIDSPGGSALASDLIWKKLMKLRADKPVVVSVGGMAASGGYYLACAGTKILAEPTSIVGSIGVVIGKMAAGKALEEIGVHAETIPANPGAGRAARAAWLSPLSPWDDATRARVVGSATAIYDLFLARIAEGRGVAVDKIAPSAEGRIFSGQEAKDRGLVDEMGGLSDAIRLALDLGKLPADAPVEVVGDSPGIVELLEGDDEARQNEASRAARQVARDALVPEWISVMPELGTFVGTVAPLLQGEHVLTALPFVLAVQ